jgi:hypothetical protein
MDHWKASIAFKRCSIVSKLLPRVSNLLVELL